MVPIEIFELPPSGTRPDGKSHSRFLPYLLPSAAATQERLVAVAHDARGFRAVIGGLRRVVIVT